MARCGQARRRRRFSISRVGRLRGEWTNRQYECLEEKLPLASFIVTNTADEGEGSLAAAIASANSAAGADTIFFNIEAPSPITIFATSLPTVTDTLVIDGTTQPGYVDRPLIVLRGIEGQAGGGSSALRIEASNSVVRGLAFNRFTSGSQQNGAAITLASGSNRVEGNWIGMNASGTSADPNSLGVLVQSGSGNIIGGASASQRNVISGNRTGVSIRSSGNQVQGNYVGTDPGGQFAIGNQIGISIDAGDSNVIGPGDGTQGNLISGNDVGISIKSNSNRVEGNRIGTSADGFSAIDNGVGVQIESGQNNVIGGTTPELRNLVAGNQTGISIDAAKNRIAGNWIGVDASGRVKLGNEVGIKVAGAENVIGGTSDGQPNLISGNATGVVISGSTNRVQANRIGTDESGTTVLANDIGIQLDGEGNIIGGSEANQGNLISGNQTAILINGNRSRIQGNLIGTDVGGIFDVGNGIGIHVVEGVENTIGGTTPGARNVISANVSGIVLEGARSTTIQGNFVGIDQQGINPLGNQEVGIRISGGENLNNRVGGTQAGAGNVIAGNVGFGIVLEGDGNFVQANRIGRTAEDPESFGNGGGGILITGASNRIGGTEANAGNVIAGNQLGIRISGTGATGNIVQGNMIGVDFSASAAGNVLDGIELTAPGNTIGGPGASAGNVISANRRHGIYVHDVDARDNVIQNNSIGIDSESTVQLPNRGDGIRVENTGLDSGNLIGGSLPDDGNRIAFNLGAGVSVLETPVPVGRSTGTQIRLNQIVSNAGIGIDLGPLGVPDGVTPNDLGDTDTGPNELQNYPELTSFTPGSPTRVTGRLDSLIGTTYVIDFYSSPSVDASSHVEGRRYLGSATVGPSDLTFDVQLSAQTQPLDYITSTATSLDIDQKSRGTSEFSPLGRIEGTKFLDFLSDGITPDDEPLADYSLLLYADDGDGMLDAEQDLLVDSVVTDTDGLYRFESVRPGLHYVVEKEDERFVQTDGGDDFPEVPYYSVNMISLGEFRGLDFGNYKVPRLSGIKVIDIDNNGVSDNDVPRPDWSIDLYLDDGDEIFDPDGDELVATTETDENGFYEFVGAAPGYYFVVEVLEGDYEQTGGGDDFPAVPYYGRQVVGGSDFDDLDFANFDFPDFKGIKFVDIAGDGISEDDERHPGQIIQLWLDDGDGDFDGEQDELQRIDITNLEGRYEFIRVTPGVYHVVEVVMEDYVQTDGGDDFPNRPYYTIEVENEVNHLDLDFANAKLASIGGQIFSDRTADGLTSDDSPLEGWNLLLYRDTDQNRSFNPPSDRLVRTQTSDVDGFYDFEGIPPGRYFVVDEPQALVRQTAGGGAFPLRPYFVVDLASGEDVEGLEFANAPYFPTGFSTRSIDSSDFDRDGDVDVVVINEHFSEGRRIGSVMLLFNDGTGNFPRSSPFVVPGLPQSVIAEDLDGNGFDDLIITAVGDGTSRTARQNRVIVAYNARNGTFIQRVTIRDVGDGPIDVTAADFDGDGDLDLAVANFRSNDVTILLNNGRRRGFVKAGSFAAGLQPVSLVPFQLNDDSAVDLVVANFKSHRLSLLTNDGQGRFVLRGSVVSAPGPSDLAVGDWDGDGRNDVAVAGFLGDQVAIHYGLRLNSNGAFNERRTYVVGTPLQATRPQAVLPIDYDADGDLDLAVAASEVGVTVVLENLGERVFLIGDVLPTAGGPEALTAADFDGNQSPDISSTTIYRNFNFVVPPAVTLGGVNVTTNRNVDVSASISNDRNVVVPGERLTYTVRIKNNGPSRVDSVRVMSELPDELTNVMFTSSVTGIGSGNTPIGEVEINDLVSLDRDSEIIYLLSGTIDPDVRDEFQVAVSTNVPDRFVETNLDNNRDVDDDDVLPVVDVSVETDDGSGGGGDDPIIIPPGNVTYIVTAANAGPGLATDVGFLNRFDLPPGTRLLSAVPTKGTYDVQTNEWAVGELAVDETARLTLAIRVNNLAEAGEIIRHTVFLDSLAEIDSTPANNSSTVETRIGPVVEPVEQLPLTVEREDAATQPSAAGEPRPSVASAAPAPSSPIAKVSREQEADIQIDGLAAMQAVAEVRGDFDGDGSDELARLVGGQWMVSQSGNATKVWGSWSVAVAWRDVMSGDVDGDGLDDIVGRTDTGRWWVAKSSGQALRNSRWGRWSSDVSWSDVRIADVSGDGRADLIGRTNAGMWWVGESTGQSFVNRRAADVLAALGSLHDDERLSPMMLARDSLLDLIAADISSSR